jgi:hypothetical protein
MILTLYIGPRKLVACQSIKRGREAEWSYLGSNGVKAIVKRILCKSEPLFT